MKPIFDRVDAKWRRLEGALHFYALPAANDSAVKEFDRSVRPLRSFPGLAVQPREFLHLTLQRLDAYADEIDAATWEALADGVASCLAGIGPFEIDFAPPAVHETAVECVSGGSHGWSAVLAALRAAVAEAGLGRALTDPPTGPHYSLAYSTQPTDSAAVARQLVDPGAPTSIRITSVHLVAVTQRADGVFAFVPLREWKLSRTMKPNQQEGTAADGAQAARQHA